MRKPIVTLTTDFGTSDHFTGAMKGVILDICPNARIIDISHEIEPFAIVEGAFVVSQSYPYFPKNTIHVVVVDPGVGTSRRPILVEASGQYFLGPDNGVFSMVLAREKHRVREVTAKRLFRKPVSKTFHGRDVFAPVAAHLAAGTKPAQCGKRIKDYVRLNLDGLVLKADRFGNLITSFHIGQFPTLESKPFELRIGGHKVTRLVQTFANAEIGEVCLMVGSSGYLEVIANQASAARLLACGAGTHAELLNE